MSMHYFTVNYTDSDLEGTTEFKVLYNICILYLHN